MRNLINVGIVGLGQAGLRHLEAFTNLKNVEIVGVADPDKKKLNDFGEKYSSFYPNVYILGREYDYELLRIYNLHNSQEGIQHRTFNGVKYIICYKAYPLRVKKILVSDVKIFGQLMVIKLK